MFQTVGPTEISHNEHQPKPDMTRGSIPPDVPKIPMESDIQITSLLTPELDEQQRKHDLIKEQSLEDIKNQCSELISELDSDEDPEAIVKRHIGQLEKYNELKDIALGLVTMIADQRNLRTTDILEEMKVELSEELAKE